MSQRLKAVFVMAAIVLVWVALRVPLRGEDVGGTRVARVLDGDTIRVSRDGEEVTVRLLNVDTPETVDPDKPVECGGLEASAWLKRRLPEGEAVTLTYDVERADRYGRELARVSTSDGRVVNDEIAANGLGHAIAVGANRTWYAEVKAAEDTARQSSVGLFDPRLACASGRGAAQTGR